MPAKNGIFPRVLLVGEHGDGAGLRDRLDRQHAGHHRALGEVAGEPPVVGADLARADDALAGLELEDLVDEQERRPVRDQRLDHVTAERRRRERHASVVFESLAQPRAAAVRVALRRADRHAGGLGDLLERVAERVLQQHDLRLRRRDAGERVAQLAAELGVAGVACRIVVGGELVARAARGTRALRRSAASRHVFTTRRWSQVENCEPPRNCFSRTHTFASASCAASRASSGSRRNVPRKPLDLRRVPREQRLERRRSPSFARVTRIGSLSFS